MSPTLQMTSWPMMIQLKAQMRIAPTVKLLTHGYNELRQRLKSPNRQNLKVYQVPTTQEVSLVSISRSH